MLSCQIWPEGAPHTESYFLLIGHHYFWAHLTQNNVYLGLFFLSSPSSRISYFSKEILFFFIWNAIDLGRYFAHMNRCIWVCSQWDNGYQYPLEDRHEWCLPSSKFTWNMNLSLEGVLSFTWDKASLSKIRENSKRNMFSCSMCNHGIPEDRHCRACQRVSTLGLESLVWSKAIENIVPSGGSQEIRLVDK